MVYDQGLHDVILGSKNPSMFRLQDPSVVGKKPKGCVLPSPINSL